MPNDETDIEDVRSTLLEIVTAGLANRPDGVHLTYVGAEFARRKSVAFEQYLNILAVQGKITVPPPSRKMVPFIERYCSDLFDVKHPKTGTELLQLRPAADSVADSVSTSPNHKYKKGVWTAFVRPLPTDFRRFLNMENLGFTDVKRKPPGNVWLEIKRELITETPIDEPIDGPLVQARIGEWAVSNHVEIDALVDNSPSASFERKGPSVKDLMRIVRALPPEVAAKWSIPAEVFLHLEAGKD